MRVTGNLFFQPKTFFRGPTKGVKPKNSGISKLSKYYFVGTLNLCQEMPEPMQTESAQSVHPTRRKLPKCGMDFADLGNTPNILAHFECFLQARWSD